MLWNKKSVLKRLALLAATEVTLSGYFFAKVSEYQTMHAGFFRQALGKIKW
jgi:hypothetical protein